MDCPGSRAPALVALVVVDVLLLAIGATEALGLATAHTDTHTRVLPAATAIAVDPGRPTCTSSPPTATTCG